MMEVQLWLQTKNTADVQFAYWEKGTDGDKALTPLITTNASNHFIAKVLAFPLEPGKTYEYEVHIDDKKIDFDYPLEFRTQTLWQFRTDPPAFTFGAGSCVFVNEPAYDRPGRGYGQGMGIFNHIYSRKPDFMLWGGDNIYLREVDWNTRNGIYRRYKEFKKQPELQKLWANTHHYATWDDHDYGPNDSDRSYYGKPWSLEAFKDNWGNPNYIFKDEAVTGTFWWEDCQFFLLDDRWFRAPNADPDSSKDYFGQKQIDWLIDNLTWSRAPFKFIVSGGQMVSPSDVFENMAAYPVERKKLLDAIEKNRIRGLIFISGDRHHTAIHKLERDGTYPLHEITISPLTSNAYEPLEKEFDYGTIEDGTVIRRMQNFGMMEVSGPRTDRKLTVKIFDKNNKFLYDYVITANELK